MLENPWLRCLLTVLAVWRITHLLAREDGPWDLVVRLRRAAGDGLWGDLLDCFYCLSLWIALPFAVLLGGTWEERGLLWLALSGAAILIDRQGAHERHDPRALEPLVIETRSHDELLWPEEEPPRPGRPAQPGPSGRHPDTDVPADRLAGRELVRSGVRGDRSGGLPGRKRHPDPGNLQRPDL